MSQITSAELFEIVCACHQAHASKGLSLELGRVASVLGIAYCSGDVRWGVSV